MCDAYDVSHLCQQGNAPTTFLTTTLTLQHYIIAPRELIRGEVKAVDILDKKEAKGVDNQNGRAVENRVPGIQLRY